MGHGEDAVGPVLVGGALVAVGDAAEGGHAAAGLHDLLLRHLPDAHPVGREAGAAVEEDRGDAAQDLAVDHPAQVLEQLLGGHPELGGGLVVGALDRGHRPLQGADHGDVALVVGLRLELARGRGVDRGGERVGAPSPSPGSC